MIRRKVFPNVSNTSPHKKIFLPSNIAKGVAFLIVGLSLFCCMDGTIKYLTASYSAPVIVAIRYFVHLLIMLMILAPRHSNQLFKTQRTGLVMLRAIMLTLSSLCIALALQRMPLAETTAIAFIAPTLVALFAGLVLGEKISLFNWTALLCGFVGVLIITRPGTGLDVVGVLFAVTAAIAGATYQLLSRLLAPTEKAITLLFYTALIGAFIFCFAAPWFWDGKIPDSMELALLISTGITGGLGHYFFTLAFRYAPASVLAPITYLQLIMASFLGWLIFDSIPDQFSILGMAVIVFSGLIIIIGPKLRTFNRR